MLNALLVFVGGGLGSLCRYGIGLLIPTSSSLSFPYPTLVANIIACAILGFVAGLALKDQYKLLLGTGFCGGFSTFSTFSKESLALMQGGQHLTALLYIGSSLLVGLVAVYLGMLLAQTVK